MLELLKRRGECTEENFDAMGLLQTLCLVKMDNVDGNKQTGAAGKQDRVKTNAADSDSSPAGAATNSCSHPNTTVDIKTETEMKGENREAIVVEMKLTIVDDKRMKKDTNIHISVQNNEHSSQSTVMI